MTTLKRLRRLYRYHATAAEACENWATHDQIMQHASWLRAGVNLIKRLRRENQQLRERLVRQACYYERIEASTQPPSWPLLEPDEDPGASL